MDSLFNLDNKFFQSVGKLVDMICLSVLWLLLCVPVVTAGAATTAMYYTVNKVIRHNRGYLVKDYFGAFKSNFKQSTIVWLILLAVYALLGVDFYIMFEYAKAGEQYGAFYIVFIVLIAFVSMWAMYLFPYMARFANTTKNVIKNAMLIALANLLKTIVMFVLLIAAIVIVMLCPVAIVLVPSCFTLIQNMFMEKIFRKYMTPEDIAAEEERNREYMN